MLPDPVELPPDVTGTFEGLDVTPIDDPSDDPPLMFPDPVELPPDVTGIFEGVTPIEGPVEPLSEDPLPVFPDPVELPPDVTGILGGHGVTPVEDPPPVILPEVPEPG